MGTDSTAQTAPQPKRRRRRIWPWVLLALIVGAFWFGHERVLIWAARKGIAYVEPRLGIRLDVGTMHLHLFRPIEFDDVRFTVMNPPASRTNATAKAIRLTPSSLWQVIFGDGRVFRDLRVESLEGTFDFRRVATIQRPMTSFTREQQEKMAAMELRFLPKKVEVVSSDAVFLADGQSYTVRGLDAMFSDQSSGHFQIRQAVIQAGSIHQELANLQAVTAWKDGAMYLSDLHLRKEIVLRQFVTNFVNIGGLSLDWDLGAYGGTLRGSITFGEENHEPALDAALAVVNLPVKSIPDLIALHARTDGIIRDARLTFRGNPAHPLDNEISLRLSADNFRWNERGWQSLVAGVNYIGRRLYITTFDLTQADNSISLSGQLAVPEEPKDLPRARYNATLSADVRDLSALAALAGPPFDQLKGQLYAQGSVEGDNGRIDGYLDTRASGIQYSSLPAASARLSLTAKDDELDIGYAGLWADKDHLEAKGTIGIHAPHRYAGEITGRIEDLGVYTPFAGDAVAKNVFTGAATINWQGDGAQDTHSGAFEIKLDKVMTSATPTGLTGEFDATYSPDNIYFRTVELRHGELDLNTKLTISSSGVNVTGLTLKRGKLGLLSGDGYLPLDIFALSSGKKLAQALDTKKQVYANFTSADLPVADLIQMAGQHATVRGQVRLSLGATGTLPQLALTGRLTGRDLSASIDNFTVPPTTANVSLETGNGGLRVKGSVQTQGFQPVTVDALMPFAYEETSDGGVRLFHDNAPISARMSFPGTSLEIFRPFAPAARQLQGTLAGSVNVSGTLNAPKIDGEATVTGGRIEMGPNDPVINELSGRVTMNTSRITLESLSGDVGAGPFEASGWADITNPQVPAVHLQFKGTKVLLARDPGLRLRADIDLAADGRGTSGSVTGSIGLVDGRIFKRLEVTPLIVKSPVNPQVFTPPMLAGIVPDPIGRWNVNVTIKDSEPFLIMGNLATGNISPDLTLGGTLGNPFLTGTVYLKNLQAYLPATTLLIPEGEIYFTQQNPFMPILDVRARTETSGYNIQMYAYGPLSDSKLIMRSDPPLSQENLILLVTTGFAPAGMSGSGLGEAAAGQGGIILLRSIARQLEPLGLDLNSFVNRLSVNVLPPKEPSQSASLLSELRLIDGFSLTTGRDGYGFYNAGVRYTIQLR